MHSTNSFVIADAGHAANLKAKFLADAIPAEDLTGHLPDGVHFDTPSYKILGERYFKAMEQKK